MAEEEEKANEETEQDPVEALQQTAKSQLTLLFAAGASSAVFLGVLGFTYISLSGQILTVTQEPLIEMKNLSGLVSEEYSNLTLAVEFYNHQMRSLNQRLDQVNPAIDQAQFAEVKEVIIEQEQDFQTFLGSAQLAVFGLSEMVSGSRAWRDDFKNKLDIAIASSEARQLGILEEQSPDSASEQTMDDLSAP